MRVASGLLSDTLWMAGLDLAGPSPRLSRSQILALRSQGLVRPTDLMRGDDEADTKRINALGGVESLFRSLANQIRDAARAWKHKQRTHCMNYQIKRLSPVGGADALRAIYTVRGTGLEVALENVIRATGFRFDKLDTGRTQGRPDYELQVEGFDPIIVEVKSRESDSELIGLNGATEVLTASELLGCRDAFCVTICSPGVDPSVPTQIEACGRLCVVDVCDLAEAFVRLSEGTLTPAQFNDWLTRPGVALMEDLPSEP